MIQNFDHGASFTTTHLCDILLIRHMPPKQLEQSGQVQGSSYMVQGHLAMSQCLKSTANILDIGSGFETLSLVAWSLCSFHNLSRITS